MVQVVKSPADSRNLHNLNLTLRTNVTPDFDLSRDLDLDQFEIVRCQEGQSVETQILLFQTYILKLNIHLTMYIRIRLEIKE